MGKDAYGSDDGGAVARKSEIFKKDCRQHGFCGRTRTAQTDEVLDEKFGEKKKRPDFSVHDLKNNDNMNRPRC